MFWQNINHVIPGKIKGGNNINLLDDDNNEVDVAQTAEFMNGFYTEIGPSLATAHTANWWFSGTECEVEMDDIVITKEDILDVCKTLDITKSSIVEVVSTRVIRDSIVCCIDRVVKMFNNILSRSHIPDHWKIARVNALSKGGDTSKVTNYRPISQLPVQGKILERLIHTKLEKHLDINNILTDNQGGYRKKRSTIDTIGTLTDDILRQKNIGNFTMAAFIDIKKAFDSVNFEILFKKLEKYGVKSSNLDLLKSYLTNRKQYTVVNNRSSNPLGLRCGVPQGSILGPLLFLVYINDCIPGIENCKTLLYADDSVIYVSHHDFQRAQGILQASLNEFMGWSSRNKLTINESKTKVLFFSSTYKTKHGQRSSSYNYEWQ